MLEFWNYRKYIFISLLRQLLLVLIVFWMLLIFGFSAEDGEDSQSFSDIITGKLVGLLYPDYNGYSFDKQQEMWNRVSFIVRKTGHFGEYAILSLLLVLFLITFVYIRKHIKHIFWAELICGIYAATDEFHQSFVAGRSPKIADVFIDSMGALSAIMFVVLVILFARIAENKLAEKNRI